MVPPAETACSVLAWRSSSMICSYSSESGRGFGLVLRIEGCGVGVDFAETLMTALGFSAGQVLRFAEFCQPVVGR